METRIPIGASPGGCADLLALAFFMEDTGLELGG